MMILGNYHAVLRELLLTKNSWVLNGEGIILGLTLSHLDMFRLRLWNLEFARELLMKNR